MIESIYVFPEGGNGKREFKKTGSVTEISTPDALPV